MADKEPPAFQLIANKFVEYYYGVFDQNRADLKVLYREGSMLTFEQVMVGGVAGIVEKLMNLPFQQVRHEVITNDAQPSAEDGILVLVTGRLQAEGQDRPFSFTQSFQLKSEGESWYVLNDVFRIIYPAE
ncbi:putative nuclear transport factor NTF-2 [Massariosphaeria phaeospora]|uniref:Nuclear transport factor 2 n=1 Tax=Massariosphaeria phaeospora TaxID=100035 RepID=A0A7C8MAF4_9PLEO|nr:putative nuclear transport factor NTF-2 [Massariosphaeria phaeospora]